MQQKMAITLFCGAFFLSIACGYAAPSNSKEPLVPDIIIKGKGEHKFIIRDGVEAKTLNVVYREVAGRSYQGAPTAALIVYDKLKGKIDCTKFIADITNPSAEKEKTSLSIGGCVFEEKYLKQVESIAAELNSEIKKNKAKADAEVLDMMHFYDGAFRMHMKRMSYVKHNPRATVHIWKSEDKLARKIPPRLSA
ncbi:MAG: hypothetical protein NTW04_05945 [Elusimicrobia bacterium]|nr:hypothetical protein [Elusimicrobiota bacterium]